MPTSATHVYTNAGLLPYMDPDDAVEISVKLVASTDYAAGQVLGEVAATPGVFGVYGDAGAGGLDTARCLLHYDCQTDADGKVTLSPTASQGGGEHLEKLEGAPAYFKGTFRCQDLTGLTADAVADLGRLIQGTFSDGILVM
jgi:hypothetical protein